MNFDIQYDQFKKLLPVNTELSYTEGSTNICIRFYVPNLTDMLAAFFVREAKKIFGANFKHIWKGGSCVTFTLEKEPKYKILTAELITLETAKQFKSPSIN